MPRGPGDDGLRLGFAVSCILPLDDALLPATRAAGNRPPRLRHAWEVAAKPRSTWGVLRSVPPARRLRAACSTGNCTVGLTRATQCAAKPSHERALMDLVCAI